MLVIYCCRVPREPTPWRERKQRVGKEMRAEAHTCGQARRYPKICVSRKSLMSLVVHSRASEGPARSVGAGSTHTPVPPRAAPAGGLGFAASSAAVPWGTRFSTLCKLGLDDLPRADTAAA